MERDQLHANHLFIDVSVIWLHSENKLVPTKTTGEYQRQVIRFLQLTPGGDFIVIRLEPENTPYLSHRPSQIGQYQVGCVSASLPSLIPDSTGQLGLSFLDLGALTSTPHGVTSMEVYHR